MNTIFLEALSCKNTASRPPIWIMRQAGRYMPEYRAIREKNPFLDMVRNPEIATEVTLLPIERFGMDAAILFSDILVITEALGFPVRFEEGVGPVFDTPFCMQNLQKGAVEEVCSYVPDAIRMIKPHLKVPLIGFCGGPFTVASYMIEGRSSRDLKKTKQWMYRHPEDFHALLSMITDITITYLKMQIAAGVDAIQIFDSWTHVLSEPFFISCATQYHKKIVDGINNFPTLLFCRGSAPFAQHLVESSPAGIGFDWGCSLKDMRQHVPSNIALQGNLDPYLLYAPHNVIQNEVKKHLKSMEGDSGFICNLGHGILPDVSPEAVQTLVETVKCH